MKKNGKTTDRVGTIQTMLFVISIVLIAAALFLFRSAFRTRNEGLARANDAPEVIEITPVSDPVHYHGLILSEVMPENDTFLRQGDGFPDWLELYNGGEETVPLADCSITDGKNAWTFGDIALAPGAYLLVYADGLGTADGPEIHLNFSLSEGETVRMTGADGTEIFSILLENCAKDASFVAAGDGWTCCGYPTPGSPNTAEDYDAYEETLTVPEGLVISEVFVDGSDYAGTRDWVELYNNSDGPVEMSDYWLSDKASERLLYRLPEQTLQARAYAVIPCTGVGTKETAGFRLNGEYEHVFLSTAHETVDAAGVRNVLTNGSYGRMEGMNGWYYFDSATEGRENTGGERRISVMPAALQRDGVFSVSSATVDLSAAGNIYYTVNGTEPTARSTRYAGPFTVDATTIVKAVAVEDGALASPVAVFSYILNEDTAFPVLSLVGRSPGELWAVAGNTAKTKEIAGTISMYDGEDSFTANCGIRLSGQTSFQYLLEKSFHLTFRNCYGESSLNYDVFGNGVTAYDSLNIRKGQDNHTYIFMTELWEDLCRSISSSVLTQESRFCVMYLNGTYYGLCALHEDFSEQYYASHAGVSKDSVESQDFPLSAGDGFYREIVGFCRNHRMMNDEDYAWFCSQVDVDGLIDWAVLEGVSGNRDLMGNVRFFRSPENGNRWQIAFYDLDLAFGVPFAAVFGDSANAPYCSPYMVTILRSLLSVEEFRTRLAERYASVWNTSLGNEVLLRKIDEYAAFLRPEVARDWTRWGTDIAAWERHVRELKEQIKFRDWENYALRRFFGYSEMKDEYGYLFE